MDALTGNSNDYVYFVDGWLDASVNITSKKISATFTFKWYNPDSFTTCIYSSDYRRKNLEKESFDELFEYSF